MKKIFALLIIVLSSFGTMYATINIGKLYYELDVLQKTAYVVSGDYSDLTVANIPDEIITSDGNFKVIGVANNAFLNCNSLKSVIIGNNVSSIWNGAFSECSNLESVTIGNQWIFIEGGAFGLSNVQEIHYNGTIYDWFQKTWFPTDIANNTHYSLYINGTLLIELVVPLHVSEIRDYAFASCGSIKKLLISNNVTIISEKAFYDCINLENVSFGDHVTQIGEKAFELCEGIKTIDLPNSLQTIGIGAFRQCKSLKNVDLGSGILDIYKQAFEGCVNISSVTCLATIPPKMHSGMSNWVNEYKVFEQVDCSTIPLYVPVGSIDAYKAADQWKDFGDNIKPIQAEQIDMVEPTANPTNNTVVVEWPVVQDAAEYTITLKKEQDTVCSLNFNEQGELLSIAYKTLERQGMASKNRQAVQTTTGWQYSISGLDANTEYTYIFAAKKSDKTVIYEKAIPFKTKDTATYLENPSAKFCGSQKILRDGHLYILRNGKTYNAHGARVE